MSVETQKTSLRVLHVLGGLERGGAETFVMNIYRNIHRDSIQFDFVIHTTDHGAFYDEITSLGGRIFSCPKYKGKNHFGYAKWWKTFFETHPEYKIIHSHVRSTAAIYLKIAKEFGIKTISHSHSTSSGKGLAAIVKNVLQYPLRYTADYLFACSKESGEWLFGKKAVKGPKFIEIKNSIDLEKCSFNPVIRSKYREEMSLTEKIVYIHVGRLHPAKNHAFLLELFKKISEKDRNAVLLLVGEGELREQIINQITKLEIQESVIMLGSRGDVCNLLQAADCFLFPSLWEGVPLTVIEAQAAGLPCLISDRVTTDVAISELVVSIPVDQGTKIWEEKVAELNYLRKDVRDKIISNGYDSKTLSNWLEDFYFKRVNLK